MADLRTGSSAPARRARPPGLVRLARATGCTDRQPPRVRDRGRRSGGHLRPLRPAPRDRSSPVGWRSSRCCRWCRPSSPSGAVVALLFDPAQFVADVKDAACRPARAHRHARPAARRDRGAGPGRRCPRSVLTGLVSVGRVALRGQPLRLRGAAGARHRLRARATAPEPAVPGDRHRDHPRRPGGIVVGRDHRDGPRPADPRRARDRRAVYNQNVSSCPDAGRGRWWSTCCSPSRCGTASRRAGSSAGSTSARRWARC